MVGSHGDTYKPKLSKIYCSPVKTINKTINIVKLELIILGLLLSMKWKDNFFSTLLNEIINI